MSSRHTGIVFNNAIDEDEKNNVDTYMNIYTGGGVAAGDINHDGLIDLFFSGNMTPSRLYLNKGNLEFEDITETSGLHHGQWATGATMADVNQDGWLDIYVCASGSNESRSNLLYINNGNNTFSEQAKAFGLSDGRQNMHASFFDYDHDNDLDLFIITNPASYQKSVNSIRTRKLKGEEESTDILYRNNGDNTFTDVSHEAGILVEGYSLGLAISDINDDGWPDVFISNDFIGNDILYINNKNGTFTNRSGEYFKHTSFAGMGNDIADINNDGKVDVMELDMRPEDNLRQKLIIPPTGYDKYQMALHMGYEPQFSRNTMQLNRGHGKFSEVAMLAGLSSTDWSWSPLWADYDNDGDKDLFVTNGFLRDLGNMDYITYQNIYNTPLGTVQAKTERKLKAIKSLESARLHNYLYENEGELQFSNQSIAWGMDVKSISHGAAYADLDNDGDLDLIVNNMNEEAFIYKNNANELFARHYLRIRLKGSAKNKDGIGSKVTLYANGKHQFLEQYLNRGYESTVDPVLHFGLDTLKVVDSLEVIWPDGQGQTIRKVKSNQVLTLFYDSSSQTIGPRQPATGAPLFHEVSTTLNLNAVHRENDFVDLKIQPLLPHMHSKNGPGIAVADINGDGRDDFYMGGAFKHRGTLFVQQPDGRFEISKRLLTDSLSEDQGLLFFDADGDQDMDLYVASGGSEKEQGSSFYQDHLYLNDGKGNFNYAASALPDIRQSGSCVIAADYDRDGDMDIFVGSRLTPGNYPLPPDGYLLRNDSEKGLCKFTDVTREVAPGLLKLGMVTSALWTDVDNDGWFDLLIVGEFMPVTIFRNDHGKRFSPFGQESLSHTSGWWNSLTSGDFDGDGDIDYVAGNLGLNTRYRGSQKEPLCIYASDYDKNGSLDPVMTYYNGGVQYIIHSRDELISQISGMRLRFKDYKLYSEATFEQAFLKTELASAYKVCGEHFQSSYIENMGDGQFRVSSLPVSAQFAPAFGMLSEDFNEDGNLDLLMVGNMYATEVNNGRYDASMGLFLAGDGAGNFNPIAPEASGFWSEDDAKGIAYLAAGDRGLVVVGNNSDSLKVYASSRKFHQYRAANGDATAWITSKNGKKRKHEFYYGNTYLSNSSRLLYYTADSGRIQVTSFTGQISEVLKDKRK